MKRPQDFCTPVYFLMWFQMQLHLFPPILCPLAMGAHNGRWSVLSFQGWQMGTPQPSTHQPLTFTAVIVQAWVRMRTSADESEWTLSPASGALVLYGTGLVSIKPFSTSFQASFCTSVKYLANLQKQGSFADVQVTFVFFFFCPLHETIRTALLYVTGGEFNFCFHFLFMS